MTTALKTGDDPTKTILSKSRLHRKWLCDYNINVAVGCRHGCRFCYVPATPTIRFRPDMLAEEAGVQDPGDEWGDYVLYRESDEMAQELRNLLKGKRSWKSTPEGRGIVAMSFHTDCYQDARVADATRACLRALVDHGVPTRILTRNPVLALQDLDLYVEAAERDLVTIGSSIPNMNDDVMAAIEPRAPLPEMRLRGLRKFAEHGVPTYVSMSPTYPTQGDREIRAQLRRFRDELATLDVVFHEAINPRAGNFGRCIEAAEAYGLTELADALSFDSTQEWAEYAVDQLRTVDAAASDLGVPVKLWPGQDLLDAATGADKGFVRAAYEASSPESWTAEPYPGPQETRE